MASRHQAGERRRSAHSCQYAAGDEDADSVALAAAPALWLVPQVVGEPAQILLTPDADAPARYKDSSNRPAGSDSAARAHAGAVASCGWPGTDLQPRPGNQSCGRFCSVSRRRRTRRSRVNFQPGDVADSSTSRSAVPLLRLAVPPLQMPRQAAAAGLHHRARWRRA